ncbi:MAG: hypothetical protein Q8P41_27395 [Pseudomonadota bacterium]|nr:hypothetical protein [Pseudomonadota bacterium]
MNARLSPLAGRRLALVVAGLVVGAGAAEAVARVASASPAEELLFRAPDGALRGLYARDATLLSAPVPGFSGTIAAPGYHVDVRIDAEGLRAELEGVAIPAPAADVWLAVGDSFTLALQVDAADTFEARLGAALGVRVRNAGVDGYSTWQSLERYRRLDPVVGSRVVLLTYFLGNDLTDDEVYPLLRQRTSGADAGGAPLPPPDAGGMGLLEGLLFRNSRLYAYLRVAQARRALLRADNPEAHKFRNELTGFTRGGAGRLEQLVANSRTPLLQLRDATAAAGDRLLVAVAPPAFAVDPQRAADTLAAFGLADPDVDAPRRAVLAMLAGLDIAACDLTPALTEAEARGEAPYLRFDGHWSVAGHGVVAREIGGCWERGLGAR